MRNFVDELLPQDYGVVLTCADKDRYSHNQTFADELVGAFQLQGVRMKRIDYIREVRGLSACFADRHCKFFLCFNGFGSELSLAGGGLNLVSAFHHYGKPLIDLMHDCPIHDSMAHQIETIGDYRKLFLTDYNYAFVARLMGADQTRYSPSITFPETLGRDPARPFADRSIDVLLPIGLSNAEAVRARHSHASTYKDRVYREIFDSVVERAVSDLRIDPMMEAIVALQQVQRIDFAGADIGFLMSSILDFVKFQRRRDLVEAIKHLPLTVITDQDLGAAFPGTAFRSQPIGSFAQLLSTMADSKSVVCPLPHHTGFHERAMGAFCAGAFVLAAPNEVLETNFSHGREVFIYRSARDLANVLEQILNDGGASVEAAAKAGRRKAMERFDPANFVSTALTALSLHAPAPA